MDKNFGQVQGPMWVCGLAWLKGGMWHSDEFCNEDAGGWFHHQGGFEIQHLWRKV